MKRDEATSKLMSQSKIQKFSWENNCEIAEKESHGGMKSKKLSEVLPRQFGFCNRYSKSRGGARLYQEGSNDPLGPGLEEKKFHIIFLNFFCFESFLCSKIKFWTPKRSWTINQFTINLYLGFFKPKKKKKKPHSKLWVVEIK